MIDVPDIDLSPVAIYQEWIGSLPGSDLIGSGVAEAIDKLPILRFTVWLDEFTPIKPIPEPATWMQMIGGFAGIGVMLRSRRRRPADRDATNAA